VKAKTDATTTNGMQDDHRFESCYTPLTTTTVQWNEDIDPPAISSLFDNLSALF
jgi:hypothetical protein